MKAWYLSEERFKKRIIKRWEKNGQTYNAGNIQILKYSFRAVIYWSNLKQEKVSQVNKFETENLKLF